MNMTKQELIDLVANLAVSQAKTDEQIKAFKVGMEELKAAQAKTDAQLAKTDAQLAKTDAQLAKTDKRLAQTSGTLAKTEKLVQKLVKTSDRNERRFEALNKNFQGYQANESEIIEAYFQDAFKKTMAFKGITYDDIHFNWKGIKRGKNAELDIVLINGTKVLIVEIKRKPHISNLDQLLMQKENFPIVFDDFKDYDIDLALAGQSFYDDLIHQAKLQSISLIQPKNGGIEVVA